MSVKKVLSILSAVLLFSTILVASVLATPKEQTKEGCQTEAADYLVDILYVEFEEDWGIYDMDADQLRTFLAMIGVPSGPLMEQFVGLILADGTLVGYFGPCCFKNGVKKYVDPQDNGFPTGCCKSPDFETYPLSYVGSGDGNPCLCQSGLRPTPEGRTYGGEIDEIGDVISFGSRDYLVVDQIAGEEWIVIPLPPP